MLWFYILFPFKIYFPLKNKQNITFLNTTVCCLNFINLNFLCICFWFPVFHTHAHTHSFDNFMDVREKSQDNIKEIKRDLK